MLVITHGSHCLLLLPRILRSLATPLGGLFFWIRPAPSADWEMEVDRKIAPALRAQVQEAQTALSQAEIERRQLETVRRLEAALAEAEREAWERQKGTASCCDPTVHSVRGGT